MYLIFNCIEKFLHISMSQCTIIRRFFCYTKIYVSVKIQSMSNWLILYFYNTIIKVKYSNYLVIIYFWPFNFITDGLYFNWQITLVLLLLLLLFTAIEFSIGDNSPYTSNK